MECDMSRLYLVTAKEEVYREGTGTGTVGANAVFVVLGHASPGATDTRASMCLWVVDSTRRHETEPESQGRTCRPRGRAHRPQHTGVRCV